MMTSEGLVPSSSPLSTPSTSLIKPTLMMPSASQYSEPSMRSLAFSSKQLALDLRAYQLAAAAAGWRHASTSAFSPFQRPGESSSVLVSPQFAPKFPSEFLYDARGLFMLPPAMLRDLLDKGNSGAVSTFQSPPMAPQHPFQSNWILSNIMMNAAKNSH